MAKITHEEYCDDNYIVIDADNDSDEINVAIESSDRTSGRRVSMNKYQVEQLIDTLLYWVDKQE